MTYRGLKRYFYPVQAILIVLGLLLQPVAAVVYAASQPREPQWTGRLPEWANDPAFGRPMAQDYQQAAPQLKNSRYGDQLSYLSAQVPPELQDIVAQALLADSPAIFPSEVPLPPANPFQLNNVRQSFNSYLPTVLTPVQPVWGLKPVLHVVLPDTAVLQGDLGFSTAQIAAVSQITAQEEAGRAVLEAEAAVIINDDALTLEQKRQAIAAMNYNGRLLALLGETSEALQTALGTADYEALVAWAEGEFQELRRTAAQMRLNQRAFTSSDACFTATVFATTSTYTDNSVDLPDKELKFANRGWPNSVPGYENPPYAVDLAYNGNVTSSIVITDVAPWNHDDNYWREANDPLQPRRLFTDLPLGKPEAEAAFFDNYNGGLNQFGILVDSPAGVSLSQPVAAYLGYPGGIHPVDVTFAWDCDGPNRLNRTLGIDTFTSYVAQSLNPVTGNQFYWFRDFLVSGTGLNVDFTRYYNAQSVSSGMFGPRWSTIYDMNLRFYANGTIEVQYADGRKGYFSPDGNGGYVSEAGVFEVLTPTANGFSLETNDKVFFHFNSAGQLAGISDENNNEIGLVYTGNKLTSIIDTVGGTFTLTYNGAGYLSQVVDSAGRVYQYQYVGDKLVSAADANNNTTTYSYDASGGWLTHVIDPDGVTYIQNVYNENGQVISQLDAVSVRRLARGMNAPQTTMEYDAENRRSIQTDALGNKTIYYYDEDFRLITEEDALGYTITYTYDESDNMTSKTDKRGNTWYYTYDARGNLLSKQDPIDSFSAVYYTTDITYYEYNDKNQRISVTDALGHKTRYEYDEKGNVTKVIEPNGATTTSVYNSKGLMTSMTDALGRTTTYEYDANGKRTKIIDALGNETTFTYDSAGNMLSRTDALGRTSTYVYDANNNMIRMVDALGQQTTFEYNAKNWRTKMIDRRGNTWRWEYDDNGNILKEIDPLGREVSYTYDAMNNRLSVTNARGYTTHYEYDALYRLTKITDPLGKTTINEYDPNGNLISVTDAANVKVLEIVYDSNNRRKYVYDALGGITEYCYDALDRVIRMFDPRRAKTDMVYDNVSNLIEVHDALAFVTRFEYDLVHNRTATIDQKGLRTEFVFDALNRQKEVKNALGDSIITDYDKVGNTISMTDYMGYTSTYEYDGLNRLEKEINHFGQTTTSQYDPEGNLLNIIDALGNTVVTNIYDPANRLIEARDALGNPTVYAYDQNSNLISTTNALGVLDMAYEYNELDLLVKETNAVNASTIYEYDELRRPIRVTDPLNNKTEFTYNALGHLLTVKDARGQITTYEYDAVGNRTAMVDANGSRTEFDYNFLNQLREERNALGDKWIFGYDPVGNLVLQVNAKWQATYHVYDELHRAIQTIYGSSGQRIDYTYDKNSNQLTMTDWNGTNTAVYDELNRLTSATDYNGRTLAFEYDEVQNMDKMVYPDGRAVTMDYDQNYRLESLTDPHGRTTEWQYNDLNLITQRTNPNGTNIQYQFDNATRLIGLDNNGPSVAIASYEFILDAAGNRVTEFENRASWNQTKANTYTYDELYRLTSLQSLDGTDIDYLYDAVGNRLLMDGVPEKLLGAPDPDPVSVTYLHNQINSLLQANETHFEYDTNGARERQTVPLEATEFITVAYNLGIYTATVTTDYAYNYDGNLIFVSQYISATEGTTVTLPIMQAAYEYDGFGNRIAKHVTTTITSTQVLTAPTILHREYVYSGINVIAEYESWENSDNPNLTNYYYYGNGGLLMLERMEEDAPAQTFWYHIDGLGSTVALSNEAGETVFEVDYDAYGNLLKQDNFGLSRYNFSGEEWDEETGLVHYYARYYDPANGIWISQDDFRGVYERTQTLNRYAYVVNNPVNNVDFAGYGLLGDLYNKGKEKVSGAVNWVDEKVYQPYVKPVIEEAKQVYTEYVKPVVDEVNDKYIQPTINTVKEEYNAFKSNPRQYVNERVIEPVKTKAEEFKQNIEKAANYVQEKVQDGADWIQENRRAVMFGIGFGVGLIAGIIAGAVFCAVTAGAGCAILAAASVGLLAGAVTGGLATAGTQMFANEYDRNPETTIGTNLIESTLIGIASGGAGGAVGGAGSAVAYNAATGAPQILRAPRYTNSSHLHVQPRHHDPTQYLTRSKFKPGEGGQSFANEVFSKGKATVQSDGRIRIDAVLNRTVGTKGQSGGRVVMTRWGRIITQFPQK